MSDTTDMSGTPEDHRRDRPFEAKFRGNTLTTLPIQQDHRCSTLHDM
ncbi:hypothetical protein OHS59_40905 [Streptomyces sp. NBC_00414]